MEALTCMGGRPGRMVSDEVLPVAWKLAPSAEKVSSTLEDIFHCTGPAPPLHWILTL